MSHGATQEPEMSTVKRALLALQNTRARLEALEQARREPIAILGMGCRLPGGVDSPEAFWELLKAGRDAVAEVPASRWDSDRYYDPDYDAPGKIVTRQGGFLGDVRTSDPQFFGISPREAASIDPQQHLLLEVCWEALEHAGLVPAALEGSRTGVFVGICNQDYSVLLMNRDEAEIDAYMTTGMAHSVAAGRLAYTLGFQGPCLAVDTACSSSLVAVHLACQSLRNRECDLAVTGGVNLILCPETSINFSRNRMLSPDGRCKAFAATADGFGRGEGCGLVVLKRLSDVVPGRDRVLAVIRGSAINQDGASSGLTVPNGPAQQMVIREALDNGGIGPGQVDYVEAHGTGTALGDPIEIGALNAVFGASRSPGRPLLVGSAKTNLGHMEGAAGIGGLMKAVLALVHGEIPPHLHFHTPNPHIPWDEMPIAVTAQGMAWLAGQEPRRAGVSSFGFSGTNAHVVLEQAPPAPVPAALPLAGTTKGPERPLHLLTLTARTAAGLADLASRYAACLARPDAEPLADIAHSANNTRSLFEHRLVAVAGDATAMRARLERYAAGQLERGVATGHVTEAEAPRLAWLFTGQGSQYAGMGMELYHTHPVFRAAIADCARVLDPLLGRPLATLLSEESQGLDETAFTQPALFALEYALAQLWLSWGIKPDAVAGHSVGECVAACVAGVFSLEDGLRLVAERGRLMGGLPSGGAMAAVFAGRDRVEQAIAALGIESVLGIAAVNGSLETVVSGGREAVRALTGHLAGQGIQNRDLAVSHAFHSALMEPMLAGFERAVRRTSLSAPGIRLVSNLTGGLVASEVTDPAYWVRHVRQPVLFADGIATLRQQGMTAFLEIGPHPVLSRLLLAETPSPDAGLCLASLRKGRPAWETLLETLGGLYLGGVTVDWAGFDRPYPMRRVTLPTYPFQRKRHWYTREDMPGHRRFAPESPLVRLLQAGQADALARHLEAGGEWTAEEKALLPKLAVGLIRRNQQAGSDGDGWCYLPVWREQARKAQDPKPPGVPKDGDGAWLVLAASDTSGGGEGEPTLCLREFGRRCIRAVPGSVYRRTACDIWTINCESDDDYLRLWADIGAETPLQGIVYAWPSDLAAEPADELMRVVRLARTLARLETPPRLWLLTHNATAAGGSAPKSPFPALLWGLGRSLFLEHPELKGGMIDAAPGAELALELLDSEGEDAIVLRDGKRYLARLVGAGLGSAPAAGSEPARLKADAAYLITGGLGAMGLQTARWLAEQGAGHLVLVGRRDAGEQSRAALDRLRSQGVRVTVERADVADEAALRGVVERIAAAGLALKGVVHAAGVLSSRPVDGMDTGGLAAMLAPKVGGAWNLHRLTLASGLDFFICFSSISSVLGTAQESHYTAANGFLDGLAEYRRGLGLPALCINWGPLAGENMIDAASAMRIAAVGFRALPPPAALAVLGRLLGSDLARAAVVDADWPRIKSLYEARTSQPLLESLGGGAPEPGGEQAGVPPVLRQLRELAARDRLDFLVAYVQERVGEVLRFDGQSPPEPQLGFFDLGLDSLTAVELKNCIESQLACPLPSSVAFDYPNVEALAGHLLVRLFPPLAPTGESSANPVPRQTPGSGTDDIRQLSDAELAALINDEFASLAD
jgi:acyl transferase domain-containing protein/acyl carrier protein